MTDQLERGEEVRYNGVIMQVLTKNSDGTYALRGLTGNPLCPTVPFGEIERKVNGAFPPIKLRTPAQSVEPKPEPPPKPEKRVLPVPPKQVKPSEIVIDPSVETDVSVDRFDYSALTTEDQVAVRMAAKEVKDVMRRTAQGIVQIGESLADVQNRLAKYHTGTFDKWLRAEFAWSRSTAYRYIAVYDRFGIRPNLGQIDIAASALYLLAEPSTPDAAVEEVLETAQTGAKITYSDSKPIIAKHKLTSSKKPEKRTESVESVPETSENAPGLPDLSPEPPVSTNTETAALVVGVDPAVDGVTVIRRIDEDTGEIIDAKPDAEALRRECRAIVDGLSADKIVVLYPILIGTKQKGVMA